MYSKKHVSCIKTDIANLGQAALCSFALGDIFLNVFKNIVLENTFQ